jgi:hypothetical protein
VFEVEEVCGEEGEDGEGDDLDDSEGGVGVPCHFGGYGWLLRWFGWGFHE